MRSNPRQPIDFESARARPETQPEDKDFYVGLDNYIIFMKKVRTFQHLEASEDDSRKLVESLYLMCDYAESATEVKLKEGKRSNLPRSESERLALIVTDGA